MKNLEKKLREQLAICESPNGCDECEVIDYHVCYVKHFIKKWLGIEE